MGHIMPAASSKLSAFMLGFPSIPTTATAAVAVAAPLPPPRFSAAAEAAILSGVVLAFREENDRAGRKRGRRIDGERKSANSHGP